MTKAAATFGRDAHEFLRLPSTSAYCASLAKTGKFPELTDAQRGRYGGTWAHPKLAIRFAQWLDADFAVWCRWGQIPGSGHKPCL